MMKQLISLHFAGVYSVAFHGQSSCC